MSNGIPFYRLRTDYDGTWFVVDSNDEPISPDNVDSAMFLAVENANKAYILRKTLKKLLENCPVCRGVGKTPERCYGECIEKIMTISSLTYEEEMVKHKTHETGNMNPCRYCAEARSAIGLML